MPVAKKALIIDDDADLIEALKLVLESKGYEVHSAPEGESGYKKAEEIKPDVIILDVMMKTKDQGFQVSYRLKNNPSLSHIPILMLTSVGTETGFVFSKDDEDYLMADDLAQKPITPSELISKIEKLVKK